MKVTETTLCDTCTHFSVCMYSGLYKEFKDKIKDINGDPCFLQPIDLICKFYERRTGAR